MNFNVSELLNLYNRESEERLEEKPKRIEPFSREDFASLDRQDQLPAIALYQGATLFESPTEEEAIKLSNLLLNNHALSAKLSFVEQFSSGIRSNNILTSVTITKLEKQFQEEANKWKGDPLKVLSILPKSQVNKSAAYLTKFERYFSNLDCGQPSGHFGKSVRRAANMTENQPTVNPELPEESRAEVSDADILSMIDPGLSVSAPLTVQTDQQSDDPHRSYEWPPNFQSTDKTEAECLDDNRLLRSMITGEQDLSDIADSPYDNRPADYPEDVEEPVAGPSKPKLKLPKALKKATQNIAAAVSSQKPVQKWTEEDIMQIIDTSEISASEGPAITKALEDHQAMALSGLFLGTSSRITNLENEICVIKEEVSEIKEGITTILSQLAIIRDQFNPREVVTPLAARIAALDSTVKVMNNKVEILRQEVRKPADAVPPTYTCVPSARAPTSVYEPQISDKEKKQTIHHYKPSLSPRPDLSIPATGGRLSKLERAKLAILGGGETRKAPTYSGPPLPKSLIGEVPDRTPVQPQSSPKIPAIPPTLEVPEVAPPVVVSEKQEKADPMTNQLVVRANACGYDMKNYWAKQEILKSINLDMINYFLDIYVKAGREKRNIFGVTQENFQAMESWRLNDPYCLEFTQHLLSAPNINAAVSFLGAMRYLCHTARGL